MLVTRRLSKRSHVPLLVHDGRAVQESSAILDYIAQTLGRTQLAPQNQTLDEAHALEHTALLPLPAAESYTALAARTGAPIAGPA